MRQNVAAGKTSVGAKIQAKLALATLLNGVVIPQDAILSGEVTESVAKSATGSSRLAIRIDSAQWKNGSAPLKVYLTPWYYPLPLLANQDLYEPSAATPRPRSSDRAATSPTQATLRRSPFPTVAETTTTPAQRRPSPPFRNTGS